LAAAVFSVAATASADSLEHFRIAGSPSTTRPHGRFTRRRLGAFIGCRSHTSARRS